MGGGGAAGVCGEGWGCVGGDWVWVEGTGCVFHHNNLWSTDVSAAYQRTDIYIYLWSDKDEKEDEFPSLVLLSLLLG